MRQTKTNIFIKLYILSLIVGAMLYFVYPQGSIVLLFNKWHNPVTDVIFRFLTYLGDGLFMAAVGVFFLFVRYYNALFLTIVAVIQTILVQVGKRLIWPDAPRPYKFFSELGVDLHLVEGVKAHYLHSFPSGHTAAAFALASIIVLLYPARRRRFASLLFLGAILVAISRIYLAQHFFIDTYFGSMIGVGSAFLVHSLLKPLESVPGLQKSLLNRH